MRSARFFSVFVLGVILLQSVVALLIWQIQIHQLHAKNWNDETPENVIRITLTFTEFQKYQVNAHEICINEQMYDIKKLTKTPSGVELLTVADEQEQWLHTKIATYFASKKSVAANSNERPLTIFFSLHYFQRIHEFNFHDLNPAVELTFTRNLCYTRAYSEIDLPPPKSS